MALQRTAKSCGSDAPMLASSLREEAQMTVSNKPGHRGEREVSRKTIARGVPGDFRCDRGDYARVLCFLSHARLRAHQAPGIPCALYFIGRAVLKNSDASRREIAEVFLKLFRLFENLNWPRVQNPRRPGQAKREPGPITTNVHLHEAG